MMLLLLLLLMSSGSSAEVENMNVCGIAVIVVVAPDDAKNAADLLLESFDF